MSTGPDSDLIEPPDAAALPGYVVENAGSYAIVTCDLGNRITSWNPAAETVLGWPALEAIGQSAEIFFTPEDRAAGIPEQELHHAAEHGCAEDQRWHLKRDGSRFWAVGQMTALRVAGVLVGFAKILRDRTAERKTEDRLRIAQQAGGVGTFELFPDEGVVRVSEQFCLLWGVPARDAYPVGELIGQIHPEDRVRVLTANRVLPEHALDYIEYRIRPGDAGGNAWRWIARRGQILREPGGQVRYLGVNYDITVRKQAEEALQAANLQQQRSEIQFRQLAELAPAIVWHGAPDGGMRYLNSYWYEYTGQGAADALPHGWRAALQPQDAQHLAEVAARAQASGIPYDAECRLRRHDGEWRWFLLRAQPQRDILATASAAVTSWLGIMFDIHDRKLSEIALQDSERRQQLLLALGDRLREAARPEDVLATASGALGANLAVDRVGYAAVCADGQFRFGVGWSADPAAPLPGAMAVAVFGPDQLDCLHQGMTLVHGSGAGDGMAASGCLLDLGACIVVPLVIGNQLRTVFFAGTRRARRWQQGEVELVEEVARRTWDAVERARAAGDLERRVQEAVDERDRIWRTSPDILCVFGADGRFISVNQAVQTILGWSPAEFIAMPLAELVHPDLLQQTVAENERVLRNDTQTCRYESRFRHKDGSYRWLTWTAASSEGRVYATARDMTDIRAQASALEQAEEALRHAQKMEAVGQLTGGIAHDFNNLLQGITAPLELVLRFLQMGRTEDVPKYVQTAIGSANRAAALTHRLLAFSRRQPLVASPLDANLLIENMRDMLRGTLGEASQVRIVKEPDLWVVRCDPNQLENALLNLAINARDAMPGGGTLTVQTANVGHDGARPDDDPGLAAGDYVTICVSDTGAGMPQQVAKRAFDPFFTTKPIGQGTGLGLSMTYGFAKQSGGTATLHSTPGAGTSVCLYLPRFHGAAEAPAPQRESDVGGFQRAARRGTVLVVEDDLVVRETAAEVLREMNYLVLQAPDGTAALKILRSSRSLDLLVTDVGLPGLNGRQVADAARQIRAGLKVLFMTGYAELAASGTGFLEPGMHLITKPFTLEGFSARIREIDGG